MKEKTKKMRPPFKIHGGKFYLSSWIIKHFPEGYQEMDYLEPFAGALSVFLNKDKSSTEYINDTNLGIIQIFRALRDEPKTFITRIKRTRYTERVFNRSVNREGKEFDDYMDHAINEFILRRMSRGGLKKAFGWSTRKRGGQPGDLNAWETIIEQLPLIADRLKNVQIFQKNAHYVIKAFNEENMLCYCDPPYLPDVRTSPSAYGDDEMSTDDHIALSQALLAFKGKVIISGYPSTLYNRIYGDWRCVKKKIANHSSQQKTKKYKTECLWMNY